MHGLCAMAKYETSGVLFAQACLHYDTASSRGARDATADITNSITNTVEFRTKTIISILAVRID